MDTITLPCEAQDHFLKMQVESDEDFIIMSFFIGSFYARQSSWLGRMLERARIIGTLLLGREYLFEDIVVSNAMAPGLAAFFRQVTEPAASEQKGEK